MHTPNFAPLNGLLSTGFGGNPIKIHRVMTNYLHKITSNFCHTYRVDHLEESVKNWSVVLVAIVGMSFSG